VRPPSYGRHSLALTRFRRLLFASALAACASCASSGPPVPGPPKEVRADGPARELDRLVLADEEFEGSVLVEQRGRVLLHKGYGWIDRAHTRRVEPETPYWVASISKQFTAAAILRLAEEGRLSPEDPIGRYFPSVPEDKQPMTIHQLLTHTAGLRQNYAADGITDRDEAVRAVLKMPLQGPPGGRFSYSNDAYNLLAALVEIASGQAYEEYLAARLFRPAGLRRTGFWGSPGHESVAEIRSEMDEAVRRPNWGFRGATGIFSTTGDLLRWYTALQEGRVLSAASRRELFAAHVPVSGGHAGYGWFTSRTPWGTNALWTRGTEGFGHNTIVVAYPAERVVIVAASNAGDGTPARPTPSRRVAAILATRLFGTPIPP
jgi:CubicO group peptidase (beta-lactamase class C family)